MKRIYFILFTFLVLSTAACKTEPVAPESYTQTRGAARAVGEGNLTLSYPGLTRLGILEIYHAAVNIRETNAPDASPIKPDDKLIDAARQTILAYYRSYNAAPIEKLEFVKKRLISSGEKFTNISIIEITKADLNKYYPNDKPVGVGGAYNLAVIMPVLVQHTSFQKLVLDPKITRFGAARLDKAQDGCMPILLIFATPA